MSNYTDTDKKMTVDDCNDILFAILGENAEKHAFRWWFSFNHAFGKRPLDMATEGRVDEIYSYLFAMSDGGGS